MFAMIVIILIGVGSIFVALIIDLLQLSSQYSIVISEILFLVIPTAVYFLVTKLPVKKTLRLNALSFPAIMISFIIGILIFPMSLFLANLSQLFFHNYLQDAFVSMQSMPLLGFIGTIAVTPAICEELTMRGVLFSGYSKIDIKKAALMNGLFFGIIHLNLQQFFYAFVIGVIFTYMVHATKSLYSSMIAHFACNGISALISYFAMKSGVNNANAQVGNINSLSLDVKIIMLVILFIIFAACLVCVGFLIKSLYNISNIRTINDRIETNIEAADGTEAVSSERVFNWPVYVTFGVFIAFLILLQLASKI